jgi:hypothetical protein
MGISDLPNGIAWLAAAFLPLNLLLSPFTRIAPSAVIFQLAMIAIFGLLCWRLPLNRKARRLFIAIGYPAAMLSSNFLPALFWGRFSG